MYINNLIIHNLYSKICVVRIYYNIITISKDMYYH